ncbi:MAG: fluoride efflux transporter CrcB [Gammaproteobacteria bacterium]|nr:fluoride efflux transporter CrcB [Gammaproteobacteria bacterium]
MKQLVAIAAGGALGAVMRYGVSTAVYALAGRGFPYGTLVVNVGGSAVMGLLFVLLVERMDVDAVWRAALLVGLLGSFTTFSTFSMETLALIEQGKGAEALVNVIASVVLCLTAAWVGLVLGRQW